MARSTHARTVHRRLAATALASALAPTAAAAAELVRTAADGGAWSVAGPAAFWFLPLVVTVAARWRWRSGRRLGREERLAAPRDGSWLDALSLFPGDPDRDR